MFLNGESAPTASGRDPAAAEATYGVFVAVNAVLRALWKAHSATRSGHALTECMRRPRDGAPSASAPG